MGPSMVPFLKEVYGLAKNADKFLMSQQPALKYSWNTMVASSFWDMRLSIACAATERCGVPKPHHPSRQHRQPPRCGAAAPPWPQLCDIHGGALLAVAWMGVADTPCLSSDSRAARSTVSRLARLHDSGPFFQPFFFQPPELFSLSVFATWGPRAHVPHSSVANPQLKILVLVHSILMGWDTGSKSVSTSASKWCYP